jgi:2'-5' RNA ligase
MTSRFFIGLRPPASWLAAFDEAQVSLRYQGLSRLEWLNLDCTHISLKPLGPVGGTRIEQIELAMIRAAEACLPVELRVDVLGIFGPSRRPTFVWAGVNGDLEGLKDTREALQAELRPLGYPREGQEFKPHITLARVPDDLDRPVIGRVRDVEGKLLSVEEPYMVQQISLIHSFRVPDGYRHECVATATMAIH